MREMGWTFTEFQSTPAEIVQECWKYMNTEIKSRNMDIQEQEMRSKHGRR